MVAVNSSCCYISPFKMSLILGVSLLAYMYSDSVGIILTLIMLGISAKVTAQILGFSRKYEFIFLKLGLCFSIDLHVLISTHRKL